MEPHSQSHNQPEEHQSDQPGPPARTEETVAQRFPDRSEFPGNEITVDPDAPPSPNVAHPK